jgi:hypothetical protein
MPSRLGRLESYDSQARAEALATPNTLLPGARAVTELWHWPVNALKEAIGTEIKFRLEVRAQILEIIKIEDQSQTFVADVRLNVEMIPWFASGELRAQSKHVQEAVDTFMEGIHPEKLIYFGNAIHMERPEDWRPDRKLRTPFVAEGRIRGLGTFHNKTDLSNFPLDITELNIKVCTVLSDADLEFSVVSASLELPPDAPIHSQWSLEPEVRCVVDSTSKELSITKSAYSTATLTATARRQSGFFLSTVILPALAIQCVNLTTAFLPLSSGENRVNVTVGMFIVSTGIREGYSGHLPPVPYRTMLDKFVFFNMVLNILAVIVVICSEFGVEYAKTHADVVSTFVLVENVCWCVLWVLFLVCVRWWWRQVSRFDKAVNILSLLGLQSGVEAVGEVLQDCFCCCVGNRGSSSRPTEAPAPLPVEEAEDKVVQRQQRVVRRASSTRRR